MFVRRVGVPPRTPPMPSTLPRPPVTLLPPPPPTPLAPLMLPWNRGSGSMAAPHGAPSLPNRSANAEIWLTGFAYDLDVVLLPPPPLIGPRSYVDLLCRRGGQSPPWPAPECPPTWKRPRSRVCLLLGRGGGGSPHLSGLGRDGGGGYTVPGLQRWPPWPELTRDGRVLPRRPTSMAGAGPRLVPTMRG